MECIEVLTEDGLHIGGGTGYKFQQDRIMDKCNCYDIWWCCTIYTTVHGYQKEKGRRRLFSLRLSCSPDC